MYNAMQDRKGRQREKNAVEHNRGLQDQQGPVTAPCFCEQSPMMLAGQIHTYTSLLAVKCLKDRGVEGSFEIRKPH